MGNDRQNNLIQNEALENRDSFESIIRNTKEGINKIIQDIWDSLNGKGIKIVNGDTLWSLNRLLGNRLNIDECLRDANLIYPGDTIIVKGNQVLIKKKTGKETQVGTVKDEFVVINPSESSSTGNTEEESSNNQVDETEDTEETDKIEEIVDFLQIDDPIIKLVFIRFLSDKLKELGLKSTDVNKYFLTENRNHFILEFNDKILSINLATKDVNIIDVKELENDKEKLDKDTKSFDNILQAMEEVFSQNDHWYGSGFLDEKDTLNTDKFGPELKGKTIIELQKLAREKWHIVWKGKEKLESFGKKTNIRIIQLEEQYLKYVVGIGDKYEGGAKLFGKTKTELLYLMGDIVDAKLRNWDLLANKTEDLFLFYENLHLQIDSNTRQSESLEEVNKNFIKGLNAIIYQKLKEKGATPEIMLEFAKMITGRGIRNDWDMEDSDTANQIIMDEVMQGKGGILERLLKSDKIEFGLGEMEKNIHGKKPEKVVDEFKELTGKWGISSDELLGNKLSELSPEISYKELSVNQKIDILVLSEITEKLKKETINNINDFYNALNKISAEATNNINNSIQNAFGAKWNNWNGLDKDELSKLTDETGEPLFKGMELEFIDLFNDINGSGIFNGSDGVNNTVAKISIVLVPTVIAGILAAAAVPVAAGAAGTAYLVQGGVAGFGAFVANNAINGEGYDTAKEAGTKLGTDLGLSVVSGGVGNWASWRIGLKGLKPGLTNMKKIGIGTGAVGTDVLALGIAPEVGRQMLLLKWFYDPEHLYEENEEIDKIFLEN